MHKICPKCGIDKPFSDYSKCSARKDGVRYECKPCAVKARAEWVAKNPDRARELNRNWIAKDPERNRRRAREWAAANPERKKAADAAYRADNLDKLKEQSRLWRLENAEHLRVSKVLWAQTNRELIQGKRKLAYWSDPEKYRADATAYKKENRAHYNFLNRMRKLHVAKATPAWLSEPDRQRIRQFYLDAAALTGYTGEQYHVDHIVPLRGKDVCGLHVPWNLQLLTAYENLTKGNSLC